MSHAAKVKKFVQTEFKRLADAQKAPAMAAYMKTEMPFHGIQKPDRIPVYRTLKKEFRPASRDDYEESVLALWSLKHREEKYAAIEYASMFDEFIDRDSLELYEQLVREGAWWDFVDCVALALVGGALLKDRKVVAPIMDQWIFDDDMWIRRTALLSQNRHKKNTNQDKLFEHCLLLCHEKEFFIRKAIGWALREHSYVDAKAVQKFLKTNKEKLSPLSYKEGAKQLVRSGAMKI